MSTYGVTAYHGSIVARTSKRLTRVIEAAGMSGDNARLNVDTDGTMVFFMAGVELPLRLYQLEFKTKYPGPVFFSCDELWTRQVRCQSGELARLLGVAMIGEDVDEEGLLDSLEDVTLLS